MIWFDVVWCGLVSFRRQVFCVGRCVLQRMTSLERAALQWAGEDAQSVKKSCLETPWGRDMSIFVKHVFLRRSLGFTTTLEKSVADYVEWCFQNTKRMNVGSRYEHIMIS